jgi:hypothetical protein
MKTILSISFAALFLPTFLAHSQSSFGLRNGYPPYVDAPVFDAQGARLEGTNYAVELWGSATSDSLAPVLTYVTRQRVILPFLSGPGFGAGYFSDPEGRVFGDHLTVLGVPPGAGLAWLEVRAWDTRLGARYEDVVGLGLGGYGESPRFSAYGSNPFDLLGVPAPLIGLQSFSLLPEIPEPSAVGLLVLGGLLLFWRKCRWNQAAER